MGFLVGKGTYSSKQRLSFFVSKGKRRRRGALKMQSFFFFFNKTFSFNQVTKEGSQDTGTPVIRTGTLPNYCACFRSGHATTYILYSVMVNDQARHVPSFLYLTSIQKGPVSCVVCVCGCMRVTKEQN